METLYYTGTQHVNDKDEILVIFESMKFTPYLTLMDELLSVS